MRVIASLAFLLAWAVPAAAETVLSETGGNWAGASGEGFSFLARLSQNEDMARLVIWGGSPGSAAVAEGEPELDNPVIALGAFATKQALEVAEGVDGSVLRIVTDYADEEGTGRIVTELQFLDNQFTVVGYHHSGEMAGRDIACDVDLWKMTAVEDGETRVLEPVGFEALNASDWTWDAAYERGFCHRAE